MTNGIQTHERRVPVRAIRIVRQCAWCSLGEMVAQTQVDDYQWLHQCDNVGTCGRSDIFNTRYPYIAFEDIPQ